MFTFGNMLVGRREGIRVLHGGQFGWLSYGHYGCIEMQLFSDKKPAIWIILLIQSNLGHESDYQLWGNDWISHYSWRMDSTHYIKFLSNRM